MCHTWWPGMPRMMNLAPCYDGHVVHRLPPICCLIQCGKRMKKIFVTRCSCCPSCLWVPEANKHTIQHCIVFICVYHIWRLRLRDLPVVLFFSFQLITLRYSSWIIQRFNLELISFHLKERHERQQQEMLGARHRLWSSATKKSLQTYDIRHFGRLSYLVWHQVNDI